MSLCETTSIKGIKAAIEELPGLKEQSYYKLLYEGERNMRFVRQDQLMSPEGEARGGHELVEPDKSHVTRLPSIITFLSHDVKINKFIFNPEAFFTFSLNSIPDKQK